MVVMDRMEYEDKMKALLSGRSTYEVLRKDPSPALQQQMNSFTSPALQRQMNSLLLLKRENKLSPHMYDILRCTSGSTPLICGLPKVHKFGFPLRPILLFCSSPTYNLSKHLVTLLYSLVGATSSAVQNLKDFTHFIQQQNLAGEDILGSFDVISLFTKVPVSLALEVACQQVEVDGTLPDRSNLS